MKINKIIVVEGLDKTGKSTFCRAFEGVYSTLNGLNIEELKIHSFPNVNSPIGKSIRNELTTATPDPSIVNTPNFLSEMSHYWMEELYENAIITNNGAAQQNTIEIPANLHGNMNYLFDRYFISTLAYQAFYNNSRTDLDFIKTALKINAFIKVPTDIIFLDLPNEEILRRTVADQENGLNDANDTVDITILEKRREAYINAMNFLKNHGVNTHYIKDAAELSPEDLSKILIGKIF